MTEVGFEVPKQPVKNPGNWLSDVVDREPWHTRFEPNVLEELASVAAQAKERELQAPYISIDDISAPSASQYLLSVLDELENGRGFVVISGLDRAGYSQSELENIFWVIGLALGQAVPISADGALIGHVTDLGFDLGKPTVRNYQTREELSFHNDSCDVLGLMCLNKAKSGGSSAIASAIAVHNEILLTRPDLLRELYSPLPIDRRGEQGWPAEGNSPWFALPVFSYVDSKLTARYTVHDYYFQSQRFDDAPRLSAAQQEALEYLRTVCLDERFHVNFQLEPGDIQLVNNYCVFHSRTNYEDYPEPDRRRHLLRLWLSVPNSRRLHPVFESRYRSAEPGALRGGIAPRSS